MNVQTMRQVLHLEGITVLRRGTKVDPPLHETKTCAGPRCQRTWVARTWTLAERKYCSRTCHHKAAAAKKEETRHLRLRVSHTAIKRRERLQEKFPWLFTTQEEESSNDDD